MLRFFRKAVPGVVGALALGGVAEANERKMRKAEERLRQQGFATQRVDRMGGTTTPYTVVEKAPNTATSVPTPKL